MISSFILNDTRPVRHVASIRPCKTTAHAAQDFDLYICACLSIECTPVACKLIRICPRKGHMTEKDRNNDHVQPKGFDIEKWLLANNSK